MTHVLAVSWKCLIHVWDVSDYLKKKKKTAGTLVQPFSKSIPRIRVEYVYDIDMAPNFPCLLPSFMHLICTLSLMYTSCIFR